MPGQSLTLYYAIMATSLAAYSAAVAAIARKEKTWLNWYSLWALETVAMVYVLPGIFLSIFGPAGSYFAYAFYYATSAMLGLATAFGYCVLRPLRLQTSSSGSAEQGMRHVPWLLLLAAAVVYLPVMLAFQEYLGQPREIYALFSDAGYGLNFFGSSILVTLACVAYLFKQKKSMAGAALFLAGSAALIYLHGSKGQLIVLGFVVVLHRTYVRRKRASPMVALGVLGAASITATLLFALFGSSADLLDVVVDMANYSDAGRNAMKVIDDEDAPRYLGRLELEDEFYSRMPRMLLPAKPRAFGQVRLAQRYYPEAVREAAGTPNFGIGMQYADFGPAAILLLLPGAIFTGWMARCVVVSLERRASPGRFLLLLFFAGVTVIPLGSGYLLPEMILLAAGMDRLNRLGQSGFVPIRPGRWSRALAPAAGA